ncbi:stalk domain-containing protein [Brevibacillus sp. H7]|uniref:stalk domain-containing protein n=1 Tax=Brevibacillus sp. H7 TaxID=3349138 RepID=UPI0037F7CCA9
MKKIKVFLISVVACTTFGGSVYGEGIAKKIYAQLSNLIVLVNNEDTKMKPIIYNGSVYVPADPIAHALGASLEWEGNHKILHIKDKNYIPREFEQMVGEHESITKKLDDDLYLMNAWGQGLPERYYLLGKKNNTVVKMNLQESGPGHVTDYWVNSINGKRYLLVVYPVLKENHGPDDLHVYDTDYMQISLFMYDQGQIHKVDQFVTKELPNMQACRLYYDASSKDIFLYEVDIPGGTIRRTDVYTWDTWESKLRKKTTLMPVTESQ